VVAGTDSHPDARWVYERVQERMPGVSLATVYRALQALREAGLVLEVPQPAGASRFDANTSTHHHLTCVRCGRISDVVLALEPLRQEVQRLADFAAVTSERLEFFGLCRRCDSERPER
jgi:Fe2+ or Zn2+ uptake regulation protein